jgi:serine/threonine protein phosphatase PrpC
MTLGRVASLTDTGRKRRHNEDAYVVQPPLFAVADGMGGAQAGEIAANLAAETLVRESAGAQGIDRVTALIQAANRRVYERARETSDLSGMGTTITVALVEDGLVSIGHVGDSRAYLIRDGRLAQLTDDHSLVAELQRSGKLSAHEAERHPQRSVITRALGTDPDVDIDTYAVEPQPGDLFLLCSDGLTSMVGDESILRTVERHRDDLDAAARELVVLANRGGGEDNITVVFFDIAETGGPGEAAAADASERRPPPEEEDTLSELDRVPVIEEVPAPDDRRSRRPLFVALAAVAAVVVAMLLLLWGIVL